MTNKKNQVTCSYSLESNGVINFFKNLFGLGYKEIPSSNSIYSYELNSLSVTTDGNLNIDCSQTNGDTKNLQYRVVVDNTQVNSSISSISVIN